MQEFWLHYYFVLAPFSFSAYCLRAAIAVATHVMSIKATNRARRAGERLTYHSPKRGPKLKPAIRTTLFIFR